MDIKRLLLVCTLSTTMLLSACNKNKKPSGKSEDESSEGISEEESVEQESAEELSEVELNTGNFIEAVKRTIRSTRYHSTIFVMDDDDVECDRENDKLKYVKGNKTTYIVKKESNYIVYDGNDADGYVMEEQDEEEAFEDIVLPTDMLASIANEVDYASSDLEFIDHTVTYKIDETGYYNFTLDDTNNYIVDVQAFESDMLYGHLTFSNINKATVTLPPNATEDTNAIKFKEFSAMVEKNLKNEMSTSGQAHLILNFTGFNVDAETGERLDIYNRFQHEIYIKNNVMLFVGEHYFDLETDKVFTYNESTRQYDFVSGFVPGQFDSLSSYYSAYYSSWQTIVGHKRNGDYSVTSREILYDETDGDNFIFTYEMVDEELTITSFNVETYYSDEILQIFNVQILDYHAEMPRVLLND